MSPTQCAAPTAIATSTASRRRCAARSAPGAVGRGQQREQLVGLPAHEHVGVAQAGGEQRREASAVPERHDDPHEREVAPVAHALGDQPVEQQAADVGPGEHEAPVHDGNTSHHLDRAGILFGGDPDVGLLASSSAARRRRSASTGGARSEHGGDRDAASCDVDGPRASGVPGTGLRRGSRDDLDGGEHHAPRPRRSRSSSRVVAVARDAPAGRRRSRCAHATSKAAARPRIAGVPGSGPLAWPIGLQPVRVVAHGVNLTVITSPSVIR